MEAQIDEQMVQELLARLARIEGQIRGVSKMVQEHRPCDQILMQVMAARAALEKVAGAVVTYGIEECFALPPEQARDAIRHSVSLLTKV
ncbi:MAG: metal-sensitive transcriptional regulator [Chloroflexota bacterium]|nr:metal-sensitive transcriptional regulator [Chloroflexota bacterium]